jgi:regulator of protease activity HflC (stomatin/prohibitin superfamily)
MYNKKYIILLAVLVLLVVFIFSSFNIVNSTQRGLKFTFGKIQNEELMPGLHFKIPLIQNISKVTVQPIQLDMEIEVGPSGAITKDNQTVGADLTLFYVYRSGEFVDMYRNYGQERLRSILKTALKEAFKSKIGDYDIFSIATSQEEIQSGVFSHLVSSLVPYPITIAELKITNYDWSDDFDQQISKTMERAQQVKQKTQELLMEEQEAQKLVKRAEAQKTAVETEASGDKQAMITIAEGEKIAADLRKDAKRSDGEGIKLYNDAVKANLQMEIELRKLEIEKIRAERWNGQLVPTNNYGPIPIETGRLQPATK